MFYDLNYMRWLSERKEYDFMLYCAMKRPIILNMLCNGCFGVGSWKMLFSGTGMKKCSNLYYTIITASRFQQRHCNCDDFRQTKQFRATPNYVLLW